MEAREGRSLGSLRLFSSLRTQKGGRTDAKNPNRNADGFVLWPFQYAGFASGSSEWLGRRLGGQADVAGQSSLLLSTPSLSSLSTPSLSSLSLLVMGGNRPRSTIAATQRAANRRCDILRRDMLGLPTSPRP